MQAGPDAAMGRRAHFFLGRSNTAKIVSGWSGLVSNLVGRDFPLPWCMQMVRVSPSTR